jgi:hypothetical protein
VKGNLIHLRITPEKDSAGLQVESIALEDNSGASLNFRFDSK